MKFLRKQTETCCINNEFIRTRMLVFYNVWNHIHRDARVPKDVQVEVLWWDLINEEANQSPWPIAEVGT